MPGCPTSTARRRSASPAPGNTRPCTAEAGQTHPGPGPVGRPPDAAPRHQWPPTRPADAPTPSLPPAGPPDAVAHPHAAHPPAAQARCAAAERYIPPPATGAPTSTDPSNVGRHRPAGCRTRIHPPGSATPRPPPADPSAAAAYGPTGHPRSRTAPTGRCGPTAPSHRRSPPPTTARSGPHRHRRPRRSPAATPARPRRPTGPPLAGTTVRAQPPGPIPWSTGRPPGGTRTPPPHDGYAGCDGSAPGPAPARSGRPPDPRPTRSPADGQRVHGGDAGPRQPQRPARPPRHRPVGGRRTPAPVADRASTLWCGPSRAPGRSRPAPADQPPGPAADRSTTRRTAGQRRTSAARAQAHPRLVPRGDRHRPRAGPPTPAPTGAGRRRQARPGRGPVHAFGWRCGSARPRRTDQPERTPRAHPTRRLAGARAGCRRRVPSPGNSRPECDPSEPKAESAVQV